MENKKFGPNVIYFALGITEGRPAGAFWADKIVFEPEKRLAGGFWADKIVIVYATRFRRPREQRNTHKTYLSKLA